jgi:hypothetical protein
MAWSESDLEDALDGSDASVSNRGQPAPDADDTNRSASMQAVAKGSSPRGEMNDTERRWARLLEESEHVAAWKYEEEGYRYGANDSTHWPDFWVMREDGRIEIHEIKGYVKDAGRLRFLSCADRHPEYRWVMVVQKGKRQPWEVKYDTAGEDGSPFL